MVDRTTIVIAHRLSTVRAADLIIMLDGGRVIESGTHDELVARRGFYARLVARQMASVRQREVPVTFVIAVARVNMRVKGGIG
jgi:ATP-binding cassette subfamily C protein CydCD